VKRAASLLEAASRLDPALSSQAASLKSASLEIEESHHFLSSYLLKLEADPGRLSAVEERISSIERLKKRFGKTLEAVEAKKRELQERIEKLSHLDEQIQEMRERLEKRKGENRLLARELSEKRKRTAPPFAGAILAQLSSLNLPRAQFTVSISEKPLSSSGTDWVRFLFSANPGHSPIPLEECASGGELSRLLLAMKIVLAQKEKRSCFVFDEIDSNVGGQTASILGEKLKALSENKQVICVTHFAQVAKCAHHHFAVSKEEKKGRVFTSIAKLLSSEREIEYARMQGLQ
jgi:DNA repair protein RecN (Recombination protein N)